jgi:hypothetical protein
MFIAEGPALQIKLQRSGMSVRVAVDALRLRVVSFMPLLRSLSAPAMVGVLSTWRSSGASRDPERAWCYRHGAPPGLVVRRVEPQA